MSDPAKKHILVVENNDITRKLIVGILNNKGYETYEARTGDEAVTFLGKSLQLVVLDIENDDFDNTGLIVKLQLEHARLPLIAMTEEPDHSGLQERLGIQQVAVLAKPIVPDTLLLNIENYFVSGIEKKIQASEEAAQTVRKTNIDVNDPAALREREAFMLRAIDLSQEKMDEGCGGPFGAVVVRGGKIIAEGWNQVTSANDPTAHAEMVAIRNACTALGTFSLEGCEVYTSCEPCPMCLSALYWARVDRIFYGNTREDAEAIGFDDDFIYRELAMPEHKRSLPSKMFLHQDAKIVFDNWMKKKDKITY